MEYICYDYLPTLCLMMVSIWEVLHHVSGYSDLWTGEACRKQPVFKASAPSEPVQSRDNQLEDEEAIVKARKDSHKVIVSLDEFFKRLIIINRYLLSVHALIVFTIFCFLVDEKIELKKF